MLDDLKLLIEVRESYRRNADWMQPPDVLKADLDTTFEIQRRTSEQGELDRKLKADRERDRRLNAFGWLRFAGQAFATLIACAVGVLAVLWLATRGWASFGLPKGSSGNLIRIGIAAATGSVSATLGRRLWSARGMASEQLGSTRAATHNSDPSDDDPLVNSIETE